MSSSAETVHIKPPRYSTELINELSDLARKTAYRWAVVQPDQPSTADIEKLVARGNTNVVIQFGFIAEGKNLTHIGQPSNRCIKTCFAPPLPDEVQTFYKENFHEYFIKPWSRVWDAPTLRWFSQSVQDLMPVTACKVYKIDGRAVGLQAEFPHTDAFGLPVTQIGWIWINQGLPKEDRASVHNAVFSDLSSRPETRFQAGIHLFNIRSRRFFSKLGFQPLCAHVYLPSLR